MASMSPLCHRLPSSQPMLLHLPPPFAWKRWQSAVRAGGFCALQLKFTSRLLRAEERAGFMMFNFAHVPLG